MSQLLLVGRRYFLPVLYALVLTACAHAVHSDGWTRIEVSGKALTRSAFDHTRPPRVAGNAVYSYLYSSNLARIPLDGSAPEEIGLPGNAYGFSVDAHGRLWVISYEPLSHNIYLMTGLESDSVLGGWIWKVSPPLHLAPASNFRDDEWPFEVIAGDNTVFVLTNKRIAAFNPSNGLWHSMRLKNPPKVLFFDNPTAIVRGDRWVWIGDDGGEYGGTLYKIDARTGEMDTVDDRHAITGILPVQGQSGCVYYSSGLAHLFTVEGAIFRSCGGKPVKIAETKTPIWGLLKSDNKAYALTQGALIPLDHGLPVFKEKIGFPKKFKYQLAGIPALVMSDVLVVYSGARGEVSTAGCTPYATVLPDDAKVKLSAYKPHGTTPRDE